MDDQANKLNPYESPRATDETAPEERVDKLVRMVFAALCFCASLLLALAALVCVYAVLASDEPNPASGLIGFGAWSLLNIPSTAVMGVGILRQRQLHGVVALFFMVGTAIAIAVLVNA